MKFLKKSPALFVIGAILTLIITCAVPGRPDQTESYLNFPEKLTPITPYDVDTALESKLINAQKFGEVQRIFEVLSWQMFISLNWPLDKDGKPAADISDTGHRTWERWKESYEIFRDSGATPKPWGSQADLPNSLRGKVNPGDNEELLFRTSKFTSFDQTKFKINPKGKRPAPQLRDDIDQAFTSAIWDQRGHVVRYEIRLNKPTVDYIVKNDLYNIDGQILFSSQKKVVSFPISTMADAGAIELKFAWKIMVRDSDAMERYFTKRVKVLDSNQKVHEATVGLVGMHIGIKTVSSPQWIWATFEQVDNVETNALTKVDGHYLRPSFNNPDNSTLPINVFPTNHPLKNQVQRVIPIPIATQELNRQVQSVLNKNNSFWQYYQLIGTQWPTQPKAAAYPLCPATYKLPDAVTNKSGGMPVPTYLTNMVMETYFQGETVGGDTTSKYNMLIANEPAYFQIEGNPKDTNKKAAVNQIIFGTEGCIGCHSSASIAVGYSWVGKEKSANFGDARTGDFEWLMQRKAQFLPYKAPVTRGKK